MSAWEVMQLLIDEAPEVTVKPALYIPLQRPTMPEEWGFVMLGDAFKLDNNGKGHGGTCYLRSLGVVDTVVEWPDGREYRIPTERFFKNYKPKTVRQP